MRDGNHPRGVFPSPSGCDEYIVICVHERRIPRARLGEWTGRLTGLRDHGEKSRSSLLGCRTSGRRHGAMVRLLLH